jgi:hypothetical protein
MAETGDFYMAVDSREAMSCSNCSDVLSGRWLTASGLIFSHPSR